MSQKPQETTVLFSGGLDSTACVHFLRQDGRFVRGVFIDYGQAARDQELVAVKRLSTELNFPVEVFHYANGTQFQEGEVFGRNAFLIFSSLLFTQQKKGLIAIGVHSGTPYFDCSLVFFENISRLVENYSDGSLRLVAPFINWSKADVFNYFTDAKLPIRLTYSCELGGDRPCGRCSSCRDSQKLGIS